MTSVDARTVLLVEEDADTRAAIEGCWALAINRSGGSLFQSLMGASLRDGIPHPR